MKETLHPRPTERTELAEKLRSAIWHLEVF